jgi:hypothetical protein
MVAHSPQALPTHDSETSKKIRASGPRCTLRNYRQIVRQERKGRRRAGVGLEIGAAQEIKASKNAGSGADQGQLIVRAKQPRKEVTSGRAGEAT